MTSSGTTNFNPALGELVIFAFQQCGIRPSALLQEHMQSARTASNMLQVSWSNQGVNLFLVDKITVDLVQGQATYDVPQDTIVMLDTYITITNGQGSNQPIDRILLPISRSEYSTYPNKNMQGFTTVYWFDRLNSPTVTLWPVPDGASEQSLTYYRVRQPYDANLQGATTMDMPYRWLDAFVDGLTARLARIWAPDRAVALDAAADRSYKIAAYQDEETAQVYLTPMVYGYYQP